MFDVDWIAVGRVGPSAISRAVQSLDSKVTQQVSTAQASLNGKVGASYSVKLQVTPNGQYYAAGFGIGIEREGGAVHFRYHC